ncbi:alpha-1/alpha-2 family phenol-soluble modulin [Staphylococcus aureus]|nr:alpha-1/alpha-2 family phenol-soluble modulin [Staphylococcus aureus]HEH0759863.1 alpha-1/alpha-2 family phenol-soluble modulin [Staphylococcus aureus]
MGIIAGIIKFIKFIKGLIEKFTGK